MSRRVFVPVTSSLLADLVEQGRLAGPLRAHTVTEDLRSAWPDGVEEEWEYAAQAAAGAASLAARGTDDAPRRLVLAVDVPDVQALHDPTEPTSVEVTADVVWKRIASAHVDDVDLTAEQLAAHLDPEADGDELDFDLAWYATQEIRAFLATLNPEKSE